MSKFIERLQQVFQPLPQSMGFKTIKAEQTRPRIQLVVDIIGSKAKTPMTEFEEADALILPIQAIDIGKTVSGTWLSKGDWEEVEKAIKSGADFIILPSNGVVVSSDKKIGKILQVEAAITDVLLRTVSELPLDAVLLTEDKESISGLTWKRLMLIRRFSSLLGKPLLIEVPSDMSEVELQLIWEAGVSGIVVKADAEQAGKISHDLRKIIAKLSFPSKRKSEKGLAILPHIESEPEKPEEDEDDDD